MKDLILVVYNDSYEYIYNIYDSREDFLKDFSTIERSYKRQRLNLAYKNKYSGFIYQGKKLKIEIVKELNHE